MIHVCHFWILMTLSSFFDTCVSSTSKSSLESRSLYQESWNLSSDRSDTRTLKTLLVNDCASTADVSGFWIVFERLSVWDNRRFPKRQPNKKPNLSIKLWTVQIWALIPASLRVSLTDSYHSQSLISVWQCIVHCVGQNEWTLKSSFPLSIRIWFKSVCLWGDFGTSLQISPAVPKVSFRHSSTLRMSLTAYSGHDHSSVWTSIFYWYL